MVLMAMTIAPAQATPGTPGTPQPPVLVYSEDFSSGTTTVGTDSVVLGSYPTALTAKLINYTGSGTATGAGDGNGQTYTADLAWRPAAKGCNGWILNAQSANPDGSGTTVDGACNTDAGTDTGSNLRPAWYYLRYMAYALGLAQGQSDPLTNYVVGDMTNGSSQAAGILFTTKENTIPMIAGHYYVTSAYFAEMNCDKYQAANHSSEQFSLVVNGTAVDVTPALGLHPCDGPSVTWSDGTSGPLNVVNPAFPDNPKVGRVWVSQLQSSAYLAPADGTMGLQISNATAKTNGNDIAFDLPQIVDVTPQLDKAFSPVKIASGGVSTLTFTVTNTSELGEKDGWSFTDALPAGMTVAPAPDASTTCGSPTVTAPADATSVAVAGSLTQGMASCQVTVNVTASAGGDYQNSAGNVTANGLLAPGAATLTVPPVTTLDLTETYAVAGSTGAAKPSATEVGDVVTYTYVVTNTGNVPVSGLTLNDTGAYQGLTTPGFSGNGALGAATCTPTALGGTLAISASTTCTATYAVTQTDLDLGAPIHSVAVATGIATTAGTAPSSVTVTSPVTSASAPVTQTPAAVAEPPSGTVVEEPAPATDATQTTAATQTTDASSTGDATQAAATPQPSSSTQPAAKTTAKAAATPQALSLTGAPVTAFATLAGVLVLLGALLVLGVRRHRAHAN